MTGLTILDMQSQCGADWRGIFGCKANAEESKQQLRETLHKDRLVPPDCAFVVVGSLARLEWTDQSDLDWMLLVDGQADETHLTMARHIRERIRTLGHEKPGPSGVFGGPAFSHELIHRIGGDADSNQNTTRRVLLLLESTSVAGDDLVRTRVIRQLLKRYIEDDHGYRTREDKPPCVPRFLLNDIVRYWRTMAVDFAAKRRDRDGTGWALRRFKLRMSRKAIFAAGLAACLACYLRPTRELLAAKDSESDWCPELTTFLLRFTSISPLDILAETTGEYNAIEAARDMFGAYDKFLRVLSNPEKRTTLEGLRMEEHKDSALFAEAENISLQFQQGLSKLFFGSDTQLTECAQRYGVF